MAQTATLVAANMDRFCPVTNHYVCSDGRYLLVTVPSLDSVGTLATFGVDLPVAAAHLPSAVDVFLSDEHANVLDADGDPANDLTPLTRLDGPLSHDEALAVLGYTVGN